MHHQVLPLWILFRVAAGFTRLHRPPHGEELLGVRVRANRYKYRP